MQVQIEREVDVAWKEAFRELELEEETGEEAFLREEFEGGYVELSLKEQSIMLFPLHSTFIIGFVITLIQLAKFNGVIN